MLRKFISKPLLYEEVINQIFESIQRGEILPGQKFPTERILSEKWNVSRNVLREAFHILESRGLVISIQGKGRYLRDLPSDEIQRYLGSKTIITKLEKSSMLEIYETRKILEVNSMDLVITRSSDKDLKAIEDTFNAYKNDWLNHGITDTDFKMHECYSKATHNYMLEQTILLQIKLIEEFKSPSFSSMVLKHKMEDYINDHSELIKSIKEKNIQKAKEVMDRHISRTIDMIKKL
jgi:GntR family transcriptional repressor for pyruvate dehydrogenase complex